MAAFGSVAACSRRYSIASILQTSFFEIDLLNSDYQEPGSSGFS
jgi:hypothetical protein